MERGEVEMNSSTFGYENNPSLWKIATIIWWGITWIVFLAITIKILGPSLESGMKDSWLMLIIMNMWSIGPPVYFLKKLFFD